MDDYRQFVVISQQSVQAIIGHSFSLFNQELEKLLQDTNHEHIDIG